MQNPNALRDPLLSGAATWQKRSPVQLQPSWRKHAPSPDRPDTSWANACSAALPVAMMNLAQAYTYASLVCMGTDLDVGMVSAMHMLGLLVVQAAFCVSSGVPNFAIASSDITVAILNHKIVREVYSVASRVPLHARHDTAICALCLCTVVQGVLYLALGRMKAAEMVQYLPHPVTAGVLASTGCAIVRSALAVTTGIDVSAPSTEHSLLTLIMAWPQQVIAASTLALLVVQVSARFNPATAFLLLVRATCRYLCTLVPASLTFFYAVVGFNEASMDDLKTRGWVFSPHEGLPLEALWTTRDYSAVHWAALVPNDPLGYAAASLVCSVFAMLKNLDIESRSGLVVEVNHELSLTGLANLLCGALGGLTANHASSYISVLRNARITSRRVPTISALLTVCVLLSGFPVANFIPRFLLGGLLMAMGGRMALEWTWGARDRLDFSGKCIVGAILLTSISNRTSAIGLGLVAAAVTSHLRVSRLNALKYHVTGRSYHPQASRPLAVQAFLAENGAAIHLIGLEGFIYEGVAARLLRYVESVAERQPWLRFVVLDLHAVQGVEPSACALLGKLRIGMARRQVQLLMANLQPELLPTLFAHAALAPADGASLYPSVDAALESCEDALMLHGSPHGTPPDSTSPAESSAASELAEAATAAEAAEAEQQSSTAVGSPRATIRARLAANVTASLNADPEIRIGTVPGALSFPRRRSLPGAGPASQLPLRPYAADAAAGSAGAPLPPAPLPFAPLPLGASLPWAKLAQFGSTRSVRPGETLVQQGATSKSLYVAPISGATLLVTHEVGEGHPPLHVATLRHGGVFGGEGALFGLPSVGSVSCASCSSPLLCLSAAQLQLLRQSDPALLQQLHAAAHSQQQDYLYLLARRTTLWLGGGWSGPNYDLTAAPPAPSRGDSGEVIMPPSPSLPEGFGRRQMLAGATSDSSRHVSV